MSSVDRQYHTDEKEDIQSPIHSKQPPVSGVTQQPKKRQTQQPPLREEQPSQRPSRDIRKQQDQRQQPERQRVPRHVGEDDDEDTTRSEDHLQDPTYHAPTWADNTMFRTLFDARNGIGLVMSFDYNTKVDPRKKLTRGYIHNRSLADKYDSHMDSPATLSLPIFSTDIQQVGNLLENGTLLKEFQAATNLIAAIVEPVYRSPIIGELSEHLTPYALDNLDHDVNCGYYSNNTLYFTPGPFSFSSLSNLVGTPSSSSSSSRPSSSASTTLSFQDGHGKVKTHVQHRQHDQSNINIADGLPFRHIDVNRHYYLREHGGKVPHLIGNNSILNGISTLLFGKTTTSDYDQVNPSHEHHLGNIHGVHHDYYSALDHDVNYDDYRLRQYDRLFERIHPHLAPDPNTVADHHHHHHHHQHQDQNNYHHQQQHTGQPQQQQQQQHAMLDTFPVYSRIYTNKPTTMRNIVMTRGAGNVPHLYNSEEQYQRFQQDIHQHSEEEHIRTADTGGLYAIRLAPDLTEKPRISVVTPFSGVTNYTLDNLDQEPLPLPIINRISRAIAIERNRHAADLESINTRRLDKELLESLMTSVAGIARTQLMDQYNTIYSAAEGESEIKLRDLEKMIDVKVEESKVAHENKQRAINAVLHDYEQQLQAAKDRYQASVRNEKEQHESLGRVYNQQKKDLELKIKMHKENIQQCERELSLKRQAYRDNKQNIGTPQEITEIEERHLAELRNLQKDADRKLQEIKRKEDEAKAEYERRLQDYRSNLDVHQRKYDEQKKELDELENKRRLLSQTSRERIDELTQEVEHMKAQREKEFMLRSREIRHQIDRHQQELDALEKGNEHQKREFAQKRHQLQNDLKLASTEREKHVKSLEQLKDKHAKDYEQRKKQLYDAMVTAEKQLRKTQETFEQSERVAKERIESARREMNSIELDLCGETVEVVKRAVPVEREVTVFEEKRVLVPEYQTRYDTVITTTNSKGEVTREVLHDHHPDPAVQKQIEEAKKQLKEKDDENKGIIQTIKDTFTANAMGRRQQRVNHDYHMYHSLASRYGGGSILSDTLLDSETEEELDYKQDTYQYLTDTDDDDDSDY